MNPTPSTDIDKLVERLRERCKHSPFKLPIEEEAAQAINSLSARVRELEEENVRLKAELGML